MASFTTGFDGLGRQVRKYVYAKTRNAVKEKLDEARKKHAEGLPMSSGKQTVTDFLDRWLREVAEPNVSPKTFQTYSYLVNNYLSPGLGSIALAKLSPQQVQHFLNALSAKRLSSTTVKHCRDCLRAALNVAMRWNLLVRNPAGLAKLPRRVRRKPQVFNSSQARQFMRLIQGHRLEALFLVTLCTGMREAEVLGLGLDDLDLDGQRLRIRGSLQRVDGKLELVSTKTEESQRSVLLPTLVVAALRAHLARREQERAIAGDDWEESGRVFVTRRGTYLDARNMLRDYYKLRDGSELPAIRFHDLRHSAASLLHAAGVPSQAIRKLLGHASVRTTQEVYSHVTTDLESAAADKMDAILSAEISA